jgi:hypothetical protein
MMVTVNAGTAVHFACCFTASHRYADLGFADERD